MGFAEYTRYFQEHKIRQKNNLQATEAARVPSKFNISAVLHKNVMTEMASRIAYSSI